MSNASTSNSIFLADYAFSLASKVACIPNVFAAELRDKLQVVVVVQKRKKVDAVS